MNIFTKFGKGKTLLLTLLFALMSGSAWAYGFQKSFAEEIDGVTYYYDMWFNITDAENHYVEVTYKNTNYNSYNSMRIAIPKTVTYNDVTYTVTAIGADAFRNCTVLQYIYLSDVTSIGDNAFYGCTGLVNLTLTTGIKTIGSNAFDGCTGLTSVTIPPQMTSIGLSAFRGCTNLTSVYYNATDCTTGSYIFNDCTSDCTLTIGNDVPGIPNMAFYYFPGLKTINFGTHANFYIGDGAFTSCTGLTSVVIPDNVTSIRSYAFNGCTALTEVTIGNGITSIGDNAFTGCNNITNVYFNATNCPDAGISSTSTLWTMNGNNDCTVHVGNNVTRIPQNLFHGFTKIKNVDFGSNPILTVIGSNAFSGTGLTSVTIPNSVTTIGSSAFSGCSSLVSLDLGSVQTIETLAFFNCTGLTTLTIPASVSTIEAASWEGNGAFWSCTGLTEIWFMGATAPTITNRAVFADVPTTIPVYVPKGYPTTGAYSYFNNYKPYLRFVGGNSGDNWTVASNWTGACTDVDNDIYVHAVPANDEVVVIDGSNDPWIPDDYVAQPYKVILKDGRKIKIDNDGRLITDQALQVEVEKEIEQWTTDPVGGWYFIASPINTILHPNDVGNMVTDDDASGHTFDLYSYDATNGVGEGDPKPWVNYRQHQQDFLIENKGGYLYANKDYGHLYFNGVTKPYSEEGGANQITLAKTGWNLIGNPFTCSVYPDCDLASLNGASAVTYEDRDHYMLKPCEGFAVYGNAGDVVTLTKSTLVSLAPSQNNSLNMVLTNANVRDAKPIDNVIVSFGEGNGMPKFEFGEQNAKLYFPQDGKDYAIVYSDGQGVLPLNFEAKEDGEYSLTVSATLNSKLSTLNLIDNLTGANIDLLATPSYQFTAKKSDYASRFKLVFANENDNENEDFAFFSDGQIFVNGNGTLQMIDMQGRQLLSREAASDFCLPTSDFSKGVYVLRLVNGDQMKTQKIIIK